MFRKLRGPSYYRDGGEKGGEKGGGGGVEWTAKSAQYFELAFGPANCAIPIEDVRRAWASFLAHLDDERVAEL